VEAGWTNVCGLFRLDRSLSAHGSGLLAAYLGAGGNHHLADAIRASSLREGSFSAVAGFQLGKQPPIPGVLTLGDAESMIPPFTGNGMSMAFQAAECALAPLTAWSRGEAAWQTTIHTVQTALRRKFHRRLAIASMLHRVMLESSGRNLIHHLATANLLPFRPILSLVR
jgi:menaquinone-9 beta-reductase